MSAARSGVPGPGEMTMFAYAPVAKRRESADQGSSSLKMTSGAAAASKQIGQPAVRQSSQFQRSIVDDSASKSLPPFTSDIN